MLWIVIVILLALWALGLIIKIGGVLINILLVIALLVFIYRLAVANKKPVNKKTDGVEEDATTED